LSQQVLSIAITDPNQPIRIIQISDSHLFENPDTELLGMNTEKSFQAVVRLIKEENVEKTLSLLIATGDIAQTSSVKSYARFLDTMQTFKEPCVWLQGNHDLTDSFLAPQNNAANMNVILLGTRWVIIMMNSSCDHEIAGYFSEEELSWLTQQLAEYSDRHTLIAMHHHPIPVRSKWLDNNNLRNAEDFWMMIDQSPQVKAVVHGHVHQNLEATRGAVKVWACPSTCVQFKPHCDTFTLDDLAPGYRWLDLYNDGHINTDISRLTTMPAGVDLKSTGY
jgi:3',5'-cyclic-AMP phosphodiesterase